MTASSKWIIQSAAPATGKWSDVLEYTSHRAASAQLLTMRSKGARLRLLHRQYTEVVVEPVL